MGRRWSPDNILPCFLKPFQTWVVTPIPQQTPSRYAADHQWNRLFSFQCGQFRSLYGYARALRPLSRISSAHPGQATVLYNPSFPEVYVDSTAQLLNTNSLAPGSVLRFHGLVFNDNGTLRMDCSQINDGVPE